MSLSHLDSSLSLERIREAYEFIPVVFRDSPQFVSEPLRRRLGCRLLCQVECLNPIRSFKGRGASCFLARERPTAEPLATASAGNLGQGLACAARPAAQRLIIFAMGQTCRAGEGRASPEYAVQNAIVNRPWAGPLPCPGTMFRRPAPVPVASANRPVPPVIE
jgi:hypothetical protein